MDGQWRKLIFERLEERNKYEISTFSDIVLYNNQLLEKNEELRAESLKLSVENENLRSGNTGAANSGSSTARVHGLEKKLLTQQEELTDLHKRKGENSQNIIDLNQKLADQQKVLADKENKLAEQISVNTSLKAEVQMLTSSIHELKGLNSILRDEHTALQLAFQSLEEKLRKSMDENRQLVDRLIKYKAKDADKMNEENESFLKKRNDKMKRDLEEAASDGSRRSSSPLSSRDSVIDFATAALPFVVTEALPKSVEMSFNAHEGEVNAIQWSPVEKLVATGGADRKVKLWEVGKGVCEPRGVLVGSNAGINSVNFDTTGTLILGTSNDFATRVWSVSDQRLRHTLTGHSGKVMAAKFLGEPSKVVTGSHDRTLKIWDLRSRACTETKFAGSSCNDLVITDGSGSTIISGHFDKKIRFWDTRTDCVNDVVLSGKITSIDLSRDCKYLLCCCRDDTIKLLDLRQNQIIGTFSHESFKVGCDWSRIAFSPDGTKVAAGGADGTVFIWNVAGVLETTLKDSTAAVTAVHWHPFSSVLASVDRMKKCTIWTSSSI